MGRKRKPPLNGNSAGGKPKYYSAIIARKARKVKTAVDDLELIRPYEPNVVKAAWNIFGKSYEYRAKYNAYKEARKQAEKGKTGQIYLEEMEGISHG